MPDVKKLITGFLIIAIAASSAAFILSTSGAPNPLVVIQDGTTPSAVTDQNAFVPTQSDILDAAVQDNPDVAAALNDPKNLTTNFTQAFLNGLSVANPNGIQTDDSGNLELSAPDAAALAVQFKNDPVLSSVSLPNWDAEVKAERLNISDSVSLNDYNSAINDAFNKDFIQSGAESLVGQQNLDPSNFVAIIPSLQSAVGDVAQAPTPATLANFQKSLVAMMVYQKNMADLGTLAQTDPVKAAVVYQAEEVRYTQVLQEFSNQFQDASSRGLLTFDQQKTSQPSAAVAFINSVLGVQTAHAQWVTFDPSNFSQWILQTINAVILQILKNTLVAFIQQRVLKWIQGSGAPMFVQQFGNQLVNIAQAKAITAVASILPNYNYTCPNIGKLLGPTIANLGLTVPAAKQVPTCNLTISAGQLNNFYKNFNYGLNTNSGNNWSLYAQVLNPSNNYYGALLLSQDYVGQQSAQAAQAQQTQQIANQGFSPQMTCEDGSNPNGTSTLCDDQTQPSNQWVCTDHSTPAPVSLCNGAPAVPGVACSGVPTTKNLCANGNYATYQLACKDGSQPSTWDNNGECTDGSEPYKTTPGQTTKQVTNTALGGALQLTTNANSVAGVLASVATSLLNTIVQTGISAAVQYGTQGLTSISLSATAGGASSNGGSAPTQPVQPTNSPSLPPTQCFPKTPQCTTGSGGQCGSGYMGGSITFSATGGNGYAFNWTVGTARDANGNNIAIAANPNIGSSTAVFSTYFSDPSGVIQPTAADPIFPITIPVNVTGSDGVTDTCVAVITQ